MLEGEYRGMNPSELDPSVVVNQSEEARGELNARSLANKFKQEHAAVASTFGEFDPSTNIDSLTSALDKISPDKYPQILNLLEQTVAKCKQERSTDPFAEFSEQIEQMASGNH